MSTQQKTLGNRGEQIAADFLRAQGYILQDANWRCSHGEIDLIMVDENELVFVEVRTRRSGTAHAFASIGPRKQQTLQKLAYAYLEANEHPDDAPWRIDVVAVQAGNGRRPIIEHVQNALGW